MKIKSLQLLAQTIIKTDTCEASGPEGTIQLVIDNLKILSVYAEANTVNVQSHIEFLAKKNTLLESISSKSNKKYIGVNDYGAMIMNSKTESAYMFGNDLLGNYKWKMLKHLKIKSDDEDIYSVMAKILKEMTYYSTSTEWKRWSMSKSQFENNF